MNNPRRRWYQHLRVFVLDIPYYALYVPRAVTRAVGDFCYLWGTSRQSRHFLLAMPAVIAASIFLAVVYQSSLTRESDVAADYRVAAGDAFKSGDIRAGELWARKAGSRAPNRKETRFRWALAAAERGETAKANEIMAELAPDDSEGYPQAHLWRATQLRNQLASGGESQLDELLRHHLSIALDHQLNDVIVRQMLAQLDLRQGNIDAAVGHYEKLVLQDSSFSIVLARLHALRGDSAKAKRIAERSIVDYQRRLNADPNDHTSRIQLARLEAFVERFDRATQHLIEVVSGRTDLPVDEANRLRTELGQAFYGWAEFEKRTTPEDGKRYLELLQLALKFAPDNPQILESIAKLVRADSDTASDAHSTLMESMAEGNATPMVHLILAIAAYERGNHTTEQKHLELALEGDPGLAVAANNLAWRLAVSDPPQLERAFELINRTVEAAPGRAEFRATRGRILAMLGRNNEAILDLETALKILKTRPDINEALATLYRDAGLEELAKTHERRAARIREQESKS